MENKTNTSKKFIVAIILLLVLAAITVTGMVFAYRNQSINRDFDTIIESSNVTFLLNKQTYLDKIGEKDINLYKGAQTDVDMEVEVVGSNRVVVEYAVEFEIEYSEDERVKKNSEDLLTAIEVYRLSDGRYEFLCMLSDLAEFKGEDAKVSGIMVTEYKEVIPLRFVFSGAAGDYYDNLAGGIYETDGDGQPVSSAGIGFTIRARATASVSSVTDRYVFALNAEQFEEEFTHALNPGKTIILAGDIEIDEPLTSAGIVGIELNGCSLTLHENITVDCGAKEYDTSLRLGVTNSKATGGLDAAGGSIIVTGLKNCYLVDNRIAANSLDRGTGNITDGDVRVIMNDEATHGAVFNDLVALLKERAAAMSGDIIYHPGDNASFLFKDVFGYFNRFSLSIANDSIIKNVTDPYTAGGFEIVDAGNEETSRYQFVFYISTYEEDPFYINIIKNMSGFITLRGSSDKSIAEELLNALPDPISSSLLLRTYDVVTGKHIDWLVDDRMDGDLFDSNGIYRRNGLGSVLPKLKKGGEYDFSDRQIDIYIKVSKSGVNEGGYGDDYYTDPPAEGDGEGIVIENGNVMKTANIVTVSAKERTTFLFNNVPATIGEDIAVYDVRNYLNTDYLLTDPQSGGTDTINIREATGYDKVRIEIDRSSPAAEKGYVEVAHITGYDSEGKPIYETCTDGKGCTSVHDHIIKLVDDVDIPQNTLNNLRFDIVFLYKDGKECTITKTIGISGGLAETTKYDMTYTLQSPFVGNAYTEGTDDWFYAFGALRPSIGGMSVAVFVDYEVQGSARNYLSVTYEFVNVGERLGGVFNEQLAYFTRSGSASTGYEYTYIDKTDGQNPFDIYERKAVVQVLSSRVPTVDQITAYLTAHLYTVYYEYHEDDTDKLNPINSFRDASGNLITGTQDRNDKGELIYVDPTTGITVDPDTLEQKRYGKPLSFEVSLEIMGVIRNIDSQIADTQLYNIMLQIFDGDGNGIITSKEAEVWNQTLIDRGVAKGLIVKDTNTTEEIYYINLSGKSIASLKGLEYFKNVTGYNLDSTGLSSVSIFANLPNLKYLSFATNTVTDLSPLAYSDQLLYLNASSNRISTIEPLRYLPRLQYLNITGSAATNTISDFDALTVSTSLKRVIVTGLKTSYNADLNTDATISFQFALLQINCEGNGGVAITYANSMTLSAETLIAARVMRDLEEINRTQGTLYMPTYYFYEDKGGTVIKYRLYWYTDFGDQNLILTYNENDPNDHVVKYTIVSPIQDKAVNLGVKVYDPDDPTGKRSFDVSRPFVLTLEASYEAYDTYIYSHSDGGVNYYIKAEDAIPDRALRNKLFSMFNYYVGASGVGSAAAMGNFEGYAGNSTQIPERYVISADDIYYYTNTFIYSTYYFNHSGIKSLKGIEYFSSVIKGHLYLQNNEFDSDQLHELTKLAYMTSLTLGGDRYDFTKLLTGTLNSSTVRPVRSATLVNLYVSGCYGLDDEKVLAALYEVYCSQASGTSTNISIFITDTAWNPYTTILSREVSKLKSTATFARVGDVFNFYTENGGTIPTTSSDVARGIPISIYNTTPFLQFSSGMQYSYYGVNFTNVSTTTPLPQASLNFGYNATVNTANAGRIVYTRAFGHEVTATIRMIMKFTDRRNVAVTYNYYYLQCNIDDGGKYLDVYDGNEYLGTFNDVVASHDMRVYALSSVYAYMSNNWTNAAYRASGVADMTQNSADAIQKFYVVGTPGASLAEYKGRIAISTAMLGSSVICSSGTTVLTTVTLSTYSGDYLIKGLKYFKNVKTVTINTDTSFGDGSDLVNITSLTINRASVDFSTIRKTAPNLETLSINYYIYFNAVYTDNGNEISAFKHFPALRSFTLANRTVLYTTANTHYYWINDLSFLTGIINGGEANLTTLSAYSISGTGWTDATIAIAEGTSLANATAVKEVYVATLNKNNAASLSYQIGTPTVHNSPNYFRAIFSGSEGEPADYSNANKWIAYSATTNSDDTVTESWDAAASANEELVPTNDFTYLTRVTAGMGDYGYIRDMGLSYSNDGGSTYTQWLDTWSSHVPNGYMTAGTNTTLRLPISTALTYYGLIFNDEDAADGLEGVVDPNRDFRIQWSIYVEYKDGTTSYEQTPHISGNLGYDSSLNSKMTKSAYPSIKYSTIRDNPGELYYTYNFGGHGYTDAYVVIFGTLYTGNNDGVTTGYSYWYEFKVGAGDGIYINDGTSGVVDKALRWWMFANRNTVSTTTTISISSTFTSANVTTGYYSLRKTDLYSTSNIDILTSSGAGRTLTPLPIVAYTAANYFEYKHVSELTGIADVVEHWGNVRGSTVTGVDKITSFTFTNPRFTDISPLYAFENLTTLVLNGTTTSYYGYVRLNASITGKFLYLQELNLQYNPSITPDDIELLCSTARNLTTLRLNYTRCMYNAEMVDIIERLMDVNSKSQFSLTLNNATLDTVTKAGHIATWKKALNLNSVFGGPLSKSSGIYNSTATSATDSFTIDGTTFTYAMSANLTSFIKGYDIADSVDIKLNITTGTATAQAGYRQFSGIYGDTTFNRNDLTDTMKLGRNKDTIDKFDTELVAYLFSTTYIVEYETNCYWFNRGANVAIALPAFKTLDKNGVNANILYSTLYSSSFAFSYSPTYAVNYAMSYKDNTDFAYAPPVANVTPDAGNYTIRNVISELIYQRLDSNGINPSVKNDFTYMEGSQPSYEAQLPNYVLHKGLLYKIGWYVSGFYNDVNSGTTPLLTAYTTGNVPDGPGNYTPWEDENDDTTGDILYTYDDGTTHLRMNPKTIPITATRPIALLATVTPVAGGSAMFTGNSLTINFTVRKDVRLTTTSEMYVEAKKVGSELYIKAVATDEDGQPMDDYYVGDASLATTVYLGSDNRYYKEQLGDNSRAEVTVVNASQVFTSSWLVRYMYIYGLEAATGSARITLTDAAHTISRADGKPYGFLMRSTDIADCRGLDVKYGTGTTSNSTYPRRATSLEGVQIFQNMTSLLLRGGMVMDITPVENMKLETFYYDNSRDYGFTLNLQAGLTDFTPLLRGSRDTLKFFTYNAGTTQMVDMSFLLGFKNASKDTLAANKLKIYISADYYAQYYVNNEADSTYSSNYYSYNGLSYFMTSSGRTLLNQLKENGVYIYTLIFYTGSTLNYSAFYYANTNYASGRTPLEYDAGLRIAGNVAGSGNLAGQTVYALKASTQDEFAYDVLKGFDSNIDGISYTDGYLMSVDASYFDIDVTTINLSASETKTVLKSITYQVDATIVGGSGYYIIDWESASESIKTGGIHLTNDLTVTLGDGTVIEYKAKDAYGGYNMLSAADIEIISDSIDYYNAQKSGLTKLVTDLTVYATAEIEMEEVDGVWEFKDTGAGVLSSLTGRAVCRIEFNGYAYNRTFDFGFIATR